MKKLIYSLAIVALAVTIGAPAVSHADTVDTTFDQVLSYGSSGPDVASLDQFLFVEGYLGNSPADDAATFDASTAAALSAFQKDNGLTATGDFDAETMAIANQKMDAMNSYAPGESVTATANGPTDLISSTDIAPAPAGDQSQPTMQIDQTANTASVIDAVDAATSSIQ